MGTWCTESKERTVREGHQRAAYGSTCDDLKTLRTACRVIRGLMRRLLSGKKLSGPELSRVRDILKDW